MKTQHKAPRFYIQAKVHTHANKSRQVGNKGCHSNLNEPRCATNCHAPGHPSRASGIQTRHSHREGCGHPSRRCLGPCHAPWPPFLPSSPPKIQARSVPSLCLSSLNSCFSEMQGNMIWTQHPNTLVFPNYVSPTVSDRGNMALSCALESSPDPLKTKAS